MRHGSRVALAVLSFALLAGAGCSGEGSPSSPSSAVFRVAACDGQTFHVMLHDPSTIRQFSDLVGSSQQKIVTGVVRKGNGGFNSPWNWHLDPATVGLADFTIELCDGCPGMVEEDVDRWIREVGRYCPWSSRVVARVQ